MDTFKILSYRPSIKSQTDYFPFGMYMPGRSYEDVSIYSTYALQTMLAPEVHTYLIQWNDGLATATGTASISGTSVLVLSAPANDGLTYVLHPVYGGLPAQLVIRVNSVTAPLNAFKAKITQDGSNISSIHTINSAGNYTIPFQADRSGDALLEITNTASSGGATIQIDHIRLDTFAFVPYTALAQISSGSGYKYGFNGQMKDNEWCGVGNHNSAL